jgi:hypothetical protein
MHASTPEQFPGLGAVKSNYSGSIEIIVLLE